MSVHVFGIRHHGPGSARSLLQALDALSPDVVLIEGPPDAAEVLPLAADAEMEPPVALIVYPPERPRLAVYYPFAAFSPEWQAIRWALEHGVPARFIDLPAAHRFAEALAEAASPSSRGGSDDGDAVAPSPPRETNPSSQTASADADASSSAASSASSET